MPAIEYEVSLDSSRKPDEWSSTLIEVVFSGLASRGVKHLGVNPSLLDAEVFRSSAVSHVVKEGMIWLNEADGD